jgi:hypothetical protein
VFLILGVIILVCFVGAVGTVAKRANRPVNLGSKSGASTRTGGGSKGGGKIGPRTSTGKKSATSRTRSGGASKPSWILKAWNASGAPKTTETTLGGAAAVVTGKAAGAGARGGRWFAANAARGGWWASKKTGKAGAWLASRTLVPFDKWLERKRAGLETAAGMPERPTEAAPAKPEPATTPPPVFVRPTNPHQGEPVTTSPELNRAAVPATLAQHLNHVHDFEPENDADLINMLAGEVQGMLGYAEAANNMFDHCVTGKGLDPAAMQGVSDYAEAFTEAAERVAAAHRQFMAVYDAVIEATNNGTVMPYNGRFFSGEAAA